MSRILTEGQYGLVNGCVFTSIDFSICVFNAKIPPIEVERKLFRLTDVKLLGNNDTIVDNVKYDMHRVDLEYHGNEYEIDFVIEIRKEILYVLEVNHKFLEVL